MEEDRVDSEEEDDELPLVPPTAAGFSRLSSLAAGSGGLPEGHRVVITERPSPQRGYTWALSGATGW